MCCHKLISALKGSRKVDDYQLPRLAKGVMVLMYKAKAVKTTAFVMAPLSKHTAKAFLSCL